MRASARRSKRMPQTVARDWGVELARHVGVALVRLAGEAQRSVRLPRWRAAGPRPGSPPLVRREDGSGERAEDAIGDVEGDPQRHALLQAVAQDVRVRLADLRPAVGLATTHGRDAAGQVAPKLLKRVPTRARQTNALAQVHIEHEIVNVGTPPAVQKVNPMRRMRRAGAEKVTPPLDREVLHAAHRRLGAVGLDVDLRAIDEGPEGPDEGGARLHVRRPVDRAPVIHKNRLHRVRAVNVARPPA